MSAEYFVTRVVNERIAGDLTLLTVDYLEQTQRDHWRLDQASYINKEMYLLLGRGLRWSHDHTRVCNDLASAVMLWRNNHAEMRWQQDVSARISKYKAQRGESVDAA